MRRVIAEATDVVCATGAAAAEIADTFPALQNRLRIVPPIVPLPSPPDRSVVQHHGILSPYALTIGTDRSHKRLRELARVWTRAASGIPLVLAGNGTNKLDDAPAVRGLGYVDHQVLNALLAGAACLVSASIAEGFGLPLLAALITGIPVVACRVPALLEVAGDAAVWVEPCDLTGLCEAAIGIARRPETCAHSRDLGRERAAEFTAHRALESLAPLLRNP